MTQESFGQKLKNHPVVIVLGSFGVLLSILYVIYSFVTDTILKIVDLKFESHGHTVLQGEQGPPGERGPPGSEVTSRQIQAEFQRHRAELDDALSRAVIQEIRTQDWLANLVKEEISRISTPGSQGTKGEKGDAGPPGPAPTDAEIRAVLQQYMAVEGEERLRTLIAESISQVERELGAPTSVSPAAVPPADVGGIEISKVTILVGNGRWADGSAAATKVMMSLCDGEQRCKILADGAAFNLRRSFKSIQITYRCAGQSGRNLREYYGSLLILECPR